MSFDVRPEKQWLTAAEAAAEQLPDFPASKSQVNRVVSDAAIRTRRRNARGGGREFHWTDLPRVAREEYLRRHGEDVTTPEADPRARAAQKDLRAEARALIVDAARAFVGNRKSTKQKALSAFCAAYEKRRVKLDEWVFRTEPCVAIHHLRTWERAVREGGTGALLDRRGRPSQTSLFDRDPPLKGFVVSTLAARPQLSATAILADIEAASYAGQLRIGKVPPLRTLQSFLASLRLQRAPEIKALANPDKFRSHHKPAFGSRSSQIVRINQRWEIDGTRADAMCRLGDGTLRRMALIALIDVFTRRAMVLVSDEGRAAATQALLRRAILAWGLPEVLKADNGKDFTAADVMRFCRETGIEVKLSRPFHPEEKPHVERFIGSLNRGLFPMLPGFVGHSVADRKAIEARQTYAHRFGEEARLVIETTLAPQGLQARIDAWLRDIYEQRLHSEIKTTPAAKAVAFADQVRRVADERALDALLMPPADGNGLRTVQKRGMRIANRFYIAPELGAVMGHRMHVRLDPHDLARIAVFKADGTTFFCIAEDAELIGDERRIIVAQQAQATQRAHVRLIRSDVREVQKHFPAAGMADRILSAAAGDAFVASDEAREAMRAAQAPRLIEQTRAALSLVESKSEPQPLEATEEQREAAAAHFAELADRETPRLRMTQCDGYERPAFAGDDIGFWQWAHTRTASGLALDTGDIAALTDLKTDATFQKLLSIKEQRA